MTPEMMRGKTQNEHGAKTLVNQGRSASLAGTQIVLLAMTAASIHVRET